MTNDALMTGLPDRARQAIVPGASHMWYPVNPAAGRVMDFFAGAGG